MEVRSHSPCLGSERQASFRDCRWMFDEIVNKSTKWVVCGAVAGVILWRRDDSVMWAITGAALNGSNSKLLKRCINQQRPVSASELKADPGMPSTHAQSLAYLTTCAAAGIFERLGLSVASLVSAFAVALCAIYMTRLRVSQGLHTSAQVIVGAAVGFASACIWLWLWLAFVQSFTLSSAKGWVLLVASFSFSVLGFVVYEIVKFTLKQCQT